MFYDIRLVDFDPDDGDAVNPCPTSGILSSKTARSVNPRYRNLVSYGIKVIFKVIFICEHVFWQDKDVE